jgi:D-sedoheptulose 7-phosphate isomerase
MWVLSINLLAKIKIKTIGLTGKDRGFMANKVDVEIRVPHFGYADRIQEIHIKIIHILILLLKEGLGLSNKKV